ncbi:MAG: TraM recognition domain-containing protein [Anaerolineae bacterium]|nr:TraM recognition domain-containing protein [Anaerolineae bacterium]
MGEFILGKDERGNIVALPPDARKQGTHMLGIQGTGKTTLLLRMALEDIAANEGVCVITPHGDLIQDLLARIPKQRSQDIIVWDPSDMARPFGFNIFACDNPADDALVSRIANDVVVKTFELLWGDSWGAQMDEVMRVVSATITRCQGMPEAERPTLTDFSRFIRMKVFRQRYLDYLWSNYPVQAAGQLDWWDDLEAVSDHERRERVRSTLNKANRFSEQPMLRNIFGQPTSSFNLRRVMDEGKILLVDLTKARLGIDDSRILGAVLVGQFYLAALSREDIPQETRRPFHLIVDEFQNFASTAFFELFEEARKYAIDLVIAHQNLTQLTEKMRERALSAGCKVVFRVNGSDADRLKKEFRVTDADRRIKGEHVRRDISIDPWRDLKRGSHKNPRVRELVRELEPSFVYYPRFADAPGEITKKIEDEITQYLYDRMMGYTPSLDRLILKPKVTVTEYPGHYEYPSLYFGEFNQFKSILDCSTEVCRLAVELPKDKAFEYVEDNLELYVSRSADLLGDIPPYYRLREYSVWVDMGFPYDDVPNPNWYEAKYGKTQNWSSEELNAVYARLLQKVEALKKPLKHDLTVWLNFLQDELRKLEGHIRKVDQHGHGDNSRRLVFGRLEFANNSSFTPVGYWAVERDEKTGLIVRERSSLFHVYAPRRKVQVYGGFSWEGYRRALSGAVTKWQRAVASASRLTLRKIQNLRRKEVEEWYKNAQASWKPPRTETHSEELDAHDRAKNAFWNNRIEWIQELGDLLADEPVYAPTGQTEPIFQTVTEAQEEYQNALTGQEKFHAWVVFTGDEETGLRQHKGVALDDAQPPPKGWEAPVDAIRHHSRMHYGRERDQVERLITNRWHLGQRDKLVQKDAEELPPER